MKKWILPLCLLLLCGCENKEENKVVINTTPEIKIEEVEEIPEEPKYVDTNPIKINMYVENDNDGKLYKVTNEYKNTWIKKKDIVVFASLYSEEDTHEGFYFQDIWYGAAEKYDTFKNYKTGWQVSFDLEDGTKINQIIYKPSDVEYFYDYLEIYLYDSANAPKDTWYSHLLDSQLTDNTIFTSMKLTAGSKYESITTPIHVMAFTYDGDDFDENGNYIGNSYTKVDVINDINS